MNRSSFVEALHRPISVRVTKRHVAGSLTILSVAALVACHNAGIPHVEIIVNLGNVAWEASPTGYLSDQLWRHPFAVRFKIEGRLVASVDMEGVPFSMSYNRSAQTLEYQTSYQNWRRMIVHHHSCAWSGVEDWMLRDIPSRVEPPEFFEKLQEEPYNCRMLRSREWDEPLIPLRPPPASIAHPKKITTFVVLPRSSVLNSRKMDGKK